MNTETPKQPEKEVPAEQWDELRNDAKQCYEKGRMFFSSSMSGSARHIFKNLSTMPLAILDPGISMRRPEVYHLMCSVIASLNKYYGLLDEFPDFKAKELSEGPGAFPEVFNTRPSPSALIDTYEKLLRGAKSKAETEK